MNSTQPTSIDSVIEQCTTVIENMTTTQGNLVEAIKLIHEHLEHLNSIVDALLIRIKQLEDKTNA